VQPVERDARFPANTQFHKIAMLHTVVFRFRRIHEHMNGGANDALLQFDHALRTHDETAGGAINIAREAHRDVLQTQANDIGERQLDLGTVTKRAENTQIGDEATARTNQGDGFFGGKVAGLVQRVIHGEFMARTEEEIEMFATEMDVPSGGVDDKGRYRSFCMRFEALQNDTADDLFHIVAVDGGMW